MKTKEPSRKQPTTYTFHQVNEKEYQVTAAIIDVGSKQKYKFVRGQIVSSRDIPVNVLLNAEKLFSKKKMLL